MNTYQCPVCGKEFKEFPSQVNKTHCCSRNCSNKLPKRVRPISERFWEKVKIGEPDECWEWQAHRDPAGYGTFRVNSSTFTKAHRVAYELRYGPIPKGDCVLHDCPNGDNPACCNPYHLWLGSVMENNADRHMKGRTAHGNAIPRSVLTESIVRLVRSEYAEGSRFSQRNPGHVTIKCLAKKYGVGGHAIRSAIIRRTWKHV